MKRRQSFATILLGKSILLREGLARILHSANFRILASVLCADDVLPGKLQLHQPLFLIVHTGEDFDTALEQVGLLRDRHPDGRIAIVTDHYRMGEVVSAFRAGANGYFADVMRCDAFIKSMELVMMGETVFPPAFLSSVLSPEDGLRAAVRRNEGNEAPLITDEGALAPQLSEREKAILSYLINGDSNKCIARKIDIAEATVKVHVKAILRKIRVHNRTQAAIWGMNNGPLTRLANNNSPPSTCDVRKSLPNLNETTPELKQIDVRANSRDQSSIKSRRDVSH
ncbi:response regulator transcription factor [Bradyrhizobium sp. WSM 1738]|uniref:LuxR C-terminal-related transcriptional regulator n=1 Tax=Bradyrhizobium hereditatis TaxID=2821405 RepID=UPI001CE2FB97|nr:response regulator transcription factor [Bradyrhizobium hereditatis]MCA6114362.1 response regulator transcription factor [Bradyrhizobium hereditatis]